MPNEYDFPDDDHGLTDREAEMLSALKHVLAVADAAAPATGMRNYGIKERDRARAVIAKVMRSLE